MDSKNPGARHRGPFFFYPVTLTLLLVTLGAYVLAPGPEQSSGQFWLGVLDREQPQQIWRLVSAHLLHTDANHLLWNLLGLAILGGIIERCSRLLLLLAVALGMACVGLWFFALTSTPFYCGWSGVLNSLLLVALYTLYWRQPEASSTSPQRSVSPELTRYTVSNAIILLVLLGALLKNLYELQTGVALVSDGQWEPAPGAHLAGWFAGLLLLGFHRFAETPFISKR